MGTLAVNVLGCLVIGVLSQLVEARGVLAPETRAFLAVGLLGGSTTFSAFANETVSALRDGAYSVAPANIFLNATVCVMAVWAGRSRRSRRLEVAPMALPQEGCLLRVFIGEDDNHDGRPLYEWLGLRAREQGLAGATVLRGLMGYGAHSTRTP